ncbi:sulfotransferase family protein [Nocardioides taihuensis]|uniref:Sulfotransferase family protein n=1 Tax=Nocardioides taihuensis TaxID=1835606 RepID=A0ABW0BM66_9ACTN
MADRRRGGAGRAGRPRVLVVLGSGRSGSTLLEAALGDVPGVEALGEVVHLPERALRDDELCACGLAFSDCPFWVAVGKNAFDGWDRVDADELIALRHEVVRTRHLPRLLAGSPTSGGRLRRDALVERLDALYRAAAEESGARLLVDSSKMPAWAALVAYADVDVHFLHVVRDPRGVAYSLGKEVVRPEAAGTDLMHRTTPREAALWWSAFELAASALRARHPGRVTTVRYEDFVADPRGTVRTAVEAAGVAVTEADLAHVSRDGVVLGTHHQVAGNPVRFTTGPVPIRPDQTWRRSLPVRDRRTVELLTTGIRRLRGYR